MPCAHFLRDMSRDTIGIDYAQGIKNDSKSSSAHKSKVEGTYVSISRIIGENDAIEDEYTAHMDKLLEHTPCTSPSEMKRTFKWPTKEATTDKVSEITKKISLLL